MKLTAETKLLLVMGAFVVLGGGALALLNRTSETLGAPRPAPTEAAPKITRAQFDDLVKRGRHTRGDASAKLTIVEFADFQCPSCRRAFATVSNHFGKDSSTRLVFYHMPLVKIHDRAMAAAIASEAAGKQGKFWPMYDSLFTGETPQLGPDDLDKKATQLGLNMDKFHADEKDPALQDLIEADTHDADSLHVDETPTFLVVHTANAAENPQVIIGAQQIQAALPGLLGGGAAPAAAGPGPAPAASAAAPS